MGIFNRSICFFLAVLSVYMVGCVWDNSSKNQEYLPLDDSEYPYAGLPRMVIETDGFHEPRDTETDLPARMQMYDKSTPDGEVIELTIKGHGNSSFKAMTKFSLKLELTQKKALLGMPQDKEWILISNFSDKTLLKNYAIFKLAQRLGASYTPRSTFVELYLNRQYQGIYLLSESIKVSKNRVNTPQNDSSFLFEKTTHYHLNGETIRTKKNTLFKIRYPKRPSDETISKLQTQLDKWEDFIYSKNFNSAQIDEWIDIDDYIRYFWLLEFSKNYDGRFGRSIFFTWQAGDIIRMGPVWDYDESFGCSKDGEPKLSAEGWHAKSSGWNTPLFKNHSIWNRAAEYWKQNEHQFKAFVDSIDVYANIIKKATHNEFRRWDVLGNTEFWAYKEGYKDYDEALDSLKSWTRRRIEWINANLN